MLGHHIDQKGPDFVEGCLQDKSHKYIGLPVVEGGLTTKKFRGLRDNCDA